MTMVTDRLGYELKRRRGVALVEFILIVTLVTVLMFGSAEFIALMNSRLILESAARDGARRVAVSGGRSDVIDERIRTQLELGRIAGDDVTIRVIPYAVSYGESIRVRLTYDSPTVTPIGRALVGDSVRLTTEVLTRSERVR